METHIHEIWPHDVAERRKNVCCAGFVSEPIIFYEGKLQNSATFEQRRHSTVTKRKACTKLQSNTVSVPQCMQSISVLL